MLSVVIIGKDEEANLEFLFRSLSNINIKKEVIYIDSASSDNSITIARKYCDKVCILDESPYISASMGRHVGTIEAKGDWILYLDGDMILYNQFVKWLNINYPFSKKNEKVAGFIGYYNYLYPNGTFSKNRILQPASGKVSHFGGAVLLKRKIVLKAGNWNPSVFANEEIDLYARIRKINYFVYGIGIPMVLHRVKNYSRKKILISFFIPINKRFYGFGQVLRSQFKYKSLFSFIRLYPYPFILWFLIIFSFFYSIFFILTLMFALYISLKKKPHYIIIYFTDLFRGFFGLFVYRKVEPTYKCNKNK